MATNIISNIDEVINQIAKLEKPNEVTTQARQNFRNILKKYLPIYKNETPKKTGELVKSAKIRQRSRRGKAYAQIVWTTDYANILNFKKNQSAEGFATDIVKRNRTQIEKEGIEAVFEAYETVIKRHNLKVKIER